MLLLSTFSERPSFDNTWLLACVTPTKVPASESGGSYRQLVFFYSRLGNIHGQVGQHVACDYQGQTVIKILGFLDSLLLLRGGHSSFPTCPALLVYNQCCIWDFSVSPAKTSLVRSCAKHITSIQKHTIAKVFFGVLCLWRRRRRCRFVGFFFLWGHTGTVRTLGREWPYSSVSLYPCLPGRHLPPLLLSDLCYLFLCTPPSIASSFLESPSGWIWK